MHVLPTQPFIMVVYSVYTCVCWGEGFSLPSWYPRKQAANDTLSLTGLTVGNFGEGKSLIPSLEQSEN